MTQKGVEAELKRLSEEEADHVDCLQTRGTGYPISTVHLPKSAVMSLKKHNGKFRKRGKPGFLLKR